MFCVLVQNLPKSIWQPLNYLVWGWCVFFFVLFCFPTFDIQATLKQQLFKLLKKKKKSYDVILLYFVTWSCLCTCARFKVISAIKHIFLSLELCLLIQTERTTNMNILHYSKNIFYWLIKSFSLTWGLYFPLTQPRWKDQGQIEFKIFKLY